MSIDVPFKTRSRLCCCYYGEEVILNIGNSAAFGSMGTTCLPRNICSTCGHIGRTMGYLGSSRSFCIEVQFTSCRTRLASGERALLPGGAGPVGRLREQRVRAGDDGGGGGGDHNDHGAAVPRRRVRDHNAGRARQDRAGPEERLPGVRPAEGGRVRVRDDLVRVASPVLRQEDDGVMPRTRAEDIRETLIIKAKARFTQQTAIASPRPDLFSRTTPRRGRNTTYLFRVKTKARFTQQAAIASSRSDLFSWTTPRRGRNTAYLFRIKAKARFTPKTAMHILRRRP